MSASIVKIYLFTKTLIKLLKKEVATAVAPATTTAQTHRLSRNRIGYRISMRALCADGLLASKKKSYYSSILFDRLTMCVYVYVCVL